MDFLQLEKYLVSHAFSMLSALFVALLGFYLARRIRNKLLKAFSKSNKHQTLKLFLTNALYALVLLIAGIMILGKLGIPTATLVTILGTSSLAVGLALKDFLSNIAAGIMLVFQRPFEVGDLIECQGSLGTVQTIDLFNTHIKTPNNEIVVIPNGKLIKEKITNKAFGGVRRLELVVPISYDSPIEKTKNLLYDIIKNDHRSLTTPTPIVGVSNLADSGIEIAVKVWTMRPDYNSLKYNLLETILNEFQKHRIQIPFNQLDIYLKNNNKQPFTAKETAW